MGSANRELCIGYMTKLVSREHGLVSLTPISPQCRANQGVVIRGSLRPECGEFRQNRRHITNNSYYVRQRQYGIRAVTNTYR